MSESRFLLALGLALAFARPLQAQVALDQFNAQPLASDGFAIARPALLEPRAWSASATLDYANDPLMYQLDRGPGLRERVVADQLALQLGAAVGVLPRLTLHVGLPVQLMMRGDANLALPQLAPEGAGLGDLSLGARIGLVRPDTGRFSLAGELIARLPTAELARPSQRYAGDRVGSYEGAAVAELRLGIVDLRLRVGVRLRAAQTLENLELGQSLLFATGVQVRLPRDVSLHAELFGSTYLSHAFRQHHTPLELLLGPKWRFAQGWLGAAAGPGLVDGYGSPDFRALATLGFASRPKPRDRDRDGVSDPADACPEQAEDRDDFEDLDGCPERDDDRDGVEDARDACPRQAEDRDGRRDDDGCPDLDDDGDGVLEDRCPDEPGLTVDAGCPAPPPVAQAPEPAEREPALEFGTVYFARGFERSTRASEPTLRAVLAILRDHPALTRVRVEGHADDTGDPAFNDGLSGRRAQWVVRWLRERGIAAERLAPYACGQRYPAQDAHDAQGRSRRVEFFEAGSPRDCEPLR